MKHTEMRQFLLEANRERLSPAEKDVFLYYQSRASKGKTWDCPDAQVAVEIGRSRNSVCEARNALKKRHWIDEKGSFQIAVRRSFSVGNATEVEDTPVGNSTHPVGNATGSVGNSTDESETRLETPVNDSNDNDLQPPKRNKKRNKEKEVKGRSSNADPRTQHPAIVAIHELTGKRPDKVLYDSLIDVLGDEPDKELLKRCWVHWRSRGWSPTNFAWALEHYPQGGPKQNGTNQQFTSNGKQTPAQIIANRPYRTDTA